MTGFLASSPNHLCSHPDFGCCLTLGFGSVVVDSLFLALINCGGCLCLFLSKTHFYCVLSAVAVLVLLFFLVMSWVGMWSSVVACPDHTHYFICTVLCQI